MKQIRQSPLSKMVGSLGQRLLLPDSQCPKCSQSYFACHCSLLPIVADEPFVPGTVKPEADYIEMQRLGKKLGLPCPQAFIKLESLGPDGELVDQYEDRSRTLNRNYWNWLFRSMAAQNVGSSFSSDTTFSAGHLTLKRTSATISNANTAAGIGAINTVPGGTVGVDTQGIVVGTGVTGESFEDAALGTRIAHGTSSGQLTYNAMATSQPTYNAGTLTWTVLLIRIFNNNSGGTIVVGETGAYASSGDGQVYMTYRDKLGATVSVLNAGQLTVTYTFTLTFPA